MVHATPKDPSRPTHYEILEEEQTQLYHAEEILDVVVLWSLRRHALTEEAKEIKEI